MTPIKTPKHQTITRITFGAFAFALVTLGCDPADEPVSDEELLAEDDEDVDALAANPADEDELDEDELGEDEPEATPTEELPTLESRFGGGFDLTAAIDAVGYAWTGFWFSEETPASLCPPGNVNTGIACAGGYCDSMQLECNPTQSVGAGTWTTWFSEEGTNYRMCEGNKYVTGMQCSGWWCDNLALYCSQTAYTPAAHECTWSGWFSEEDPPFYAPGGTAIKGVQCSGWYCDSLRYQYCTIN